MVWLSQFAHFLSLPQHLNLVSAHTSDEWLHWTSLELDNGGKISIDDRSRCMIACLNGGSSNTVLRIWSIFTHVNVTWQYISGAEVIEKTKKNHCSALLSFSGCYITFTYWTDWALLSPLVAIFPSIDCIWECRQRQRSHANGPATLVLASFILLPYKQQVNCFPFLFDQGTGQFNFLSAVLLSIYGKIFGPVSDHRSKSELRWLSQGRNCLVRTIELASGRN